MHYPVSGERIPMIRILGWNTECWVVEVTNLNKKKGRVIADCDFRSGDYGPYFTTTVDHFGHMALCRHLWSNGIGVRCSMGLRTRRFCWDMLVLRGNKEPVCLNERDWV